MMPNFLLIGAAKAGTSSLYYYLKQHPQIYMPSSRDQKEPDFFSMEGEEQFRIGPLGKMPATQTITNLKDYQALFQSVTDEIAIGEASTSYIYTEKAPQRIHHYIPDVKIIAILRDPIERAFSHFLFSMSNGWEPIRNFEKTIKAEDTRISQGCTYHWHHKERGFYFRQLKRYYDIFDHSQIRVYLYEDLKDNPNDLIKSIFEFLEVDVEFVPNTAKKHNPTNVPKNEALNSLLNAPNPLKGTLKLVLPQNIRRQVADKLKTQNSGKPKLSKRVRSSLLKEYRTDILQLQDLIDRDLSAWLTV